MAEANTQDRVMLGGGTSSHSLLGCLPALHLVARRIRRVFRRLCPRPQSGGELSYQLEADRHIAGGLHVAHPNRALVADDLVGGVQTAPAASVEEFRLGNDCCRTDVSHLFPKGH